MGPALMCTHQYKWCITELQTCLILSKIPVTFQANRQFNLKHGLAQNYDSAVTCVARTMLMWKGNTALLEAEAPDDLWYLRSQSAPVPGQLWLLAARESHQANCALIFCQSLYNTEHALAHPQACAESLSQFRAYHSAERTLQLASIPVRQLY